MTKTKKRYEIRQLENVDLPPISTSIGRVFKRCLPECSARLGETRNCRTHDWTFVDYGVVRNGTRVGQRTRKVGQSKEAAISALRKHHKDTLAEHPAGAAPGSALASKPFGEWADEWLRKRLAGDRIAGKRRTPMKETTASTYRMYLDRLDPAFKAKPLGRIRHNDVHNVMRADAQRFADKRRGPDPYNSPSTVRLWAMLRAVLAGAGDAVHPEVIDPAKVDPPYEPKATRKPEATWTREDMHAFLKAADEPRMHAAFVVLLGSGLRRGELLGLRWSNVEFFDGGADLEIEETRSLDVNGRVIHGTPKSETSARTVAVDQGVADELLRWKAEQARERDLNGADWRRWAKPDEPADLVFTREDGRAMRPERLSHYFRATVKRAGVPMIRLHELRDHFTAIALEHGASIYEVSGMLGHSSVKITEERYARLFKDYRRQQAAKRTGWLGSLLDDSEPKEVSATG
jgi:integrase